MDCPNLKKIAVGILAIREHSRFELGQKLRKHSREIEIIEETLDFLEAKGYLCDERFIEAFIYSKAKRGYGPIWIRESLKSKHVSLESIEKYLALDIHWQEQAKKLYEKKYKNAPIADSNEKLKRQRYMRSRGFTFEHFNHLLKITTVLPK